MEKQNKKLDFNIFLGLPCNWG